jgi:hypothetical protein
MRQSTAKASCEFLDLTDAFQRDWRAAHIRFEYPTDGHWNERGHQVAAQAIYDALVSRGLCGMRQGDQGP